MKPQVQGEGLRLGCHSQGRYFAEQVITLCCGMRDQALPQRRLISASSMFMFWLLTCLAASSSPYYDYTIIAQKGGTFASFSGFPSIAADGTVAFVAQKNGGGDGLYVGNGDGATVEISAGNPVGGNGFGRGVQINNSHQIVAENHVATFGTRIYRWDATLATPPVEIAAGGIATSDAFAEVFEFASINNNGQIAFAGRPKVGAGNTILGTVSASGFNTTTFSGVNDLRPLIHDGGSIAVRVPAASSTRVRLYANDVRTFTSIASASVDFTELGQSPGVSDDGNIVVFAGNRGNGRGIFASMIAADGQRVFSRVIGEHASHDATQDELGTDADGTPIYFSSIDLDRRVGIIALPPISSTSADGQFVVCFVGTPSRPRKVSTSPNDPDAFSGQSGIWTVRAEFKRSPTIRLAIRKAIPVVQIGDLIAGVPVTDLNLYDPITKAIFDDAVNPCPPTRADHLLAFWANTTIGEMIVRAAAVPIPVYPAIRQGRYAAYRYAPTQVDEYIDNLPPSLERTRLETARNADINLQNKGCLLSSYAMALNTIFDRVDLTTETLSRSGTFTPIKQHQWSRQDPTIPVFPGGADLDQVSLAGKYRFERIDPAARSTIIQAHKDGFPVLFQVHGIAHWVVSKGVTGCNANGEDLFDIVDPGSTSGLRNGPLSLSQLHFTRAVVVRRRDPFPPESPNIPGPALLQASPSLVGQDAQVILQTAGAVHVLITRSDGLRLGYEPASETVLSEIPGGTYSYEYPILTPDLEYEPDEVAAMEPYLGRFIQFRANLGDAYTVSVKGNFVGTFEIHAGGSVPTGNLGEFRVEGFINAGGLTNLQFQIKAEAPPLQIQESAGNMVVLSWPVSCPECVVQTRAELSGSAGAGWQTVTNAPTFSNGQFRVTTPILLPMQFYRLVR